MEFDRLTVIPKVSTVLTATYLDGEEANATSDGQFLSHFIGEVSEVGLDEDTLSSLYELKATGRKSNLPLTRRHKNGQSFPNPQLFSNEWHVRK